jgi:hypothetical protein
MAAKVILTGDCGNFATVFSGSGPKPDAGRTDGTTQQEIGNRYQMAQQEVHKLIAVGQCERFTRNTRNLPRSTYSLYLLTTLDDKGFEELDRRRG